VNVPSLIDLSGVVAIVASSGAVAAILQWLRDVGLDRLTQAMPDAQRNAVLRALLVVLNFGAILGLALIMGNAMSGALLLSAGLTAFLGAAGSHVLYQFVQKDAPVSLAPVTPLAPLSVIPAPTAPVSPSAGAVWLDTSVADTSAATSSTPDPFAPIVLPDVPDASDAASEPTPAPAQ